MSEFAPWPWAESLGGIHPGAGDRYRIHRILFGMVQDRCRALGLEEGVTIRCRGRDPDGVEVELPSGHLRKVELPYAWFVAVEPADRNAATG